MHENLHELSYLTDVEWKTIYFSCRVIYTERWIGEGRHDLVTGDQLVFMMQGNPAGSAIAALWGSAILSLRGTIHITFLVYQLDHIPLWRGELALGVCLGEGMIISASARIAIVYIPRKADYS